MLHITEDTPPDMLAGAMDLTVHLPTGRSVKMSVERSTPMMDLLVQITTNHHLQLSGYTLQVLGMAPSTNGNDAVLPYKPNTPIGTLDTQHIRVVTKPRTVPVPKNVPPGHQPFESTFRLKVHLPRNQLYVTRVSQYVHLGDIMRKVCEEKNLDVMKYEFRHPGNLDEVLDPKLTLSDYTITEIFLIQKGTAVLSQAFSSSDIMALRKEEERKQMQNKTGGGVFNLIFKRGKSSTGSLSSDNRSISPTHSDDSRSVTPPVAQQQIIAPPPPTTATSEQRPKPPQRKRRPAPKPPQETTKKAVADAAALTICHSRNSSDSSGYHEASILSDNCNTSLTRRPKSTIVGEEAQKLLALSGEHSQSTSNLTKMAGQSKSTSSLAFPGRKKKAAPAPPPPVLKPEPPPPPTTHPEEPSPIVASQPPIVARAESHGRGDLVANITNPAPAPRVRTKVAPSPRPRSVITFDEKNVELVKRKEEHAAAINSKPEETVEVVNSKFVDRETYETVNPRVELKTRPAEEVIRETNLQVTSEDVVDGPKETRSVRKSEKEVQVASKVKPPEVVAFHPKTKQDRYNKSMFDSYTRKRGFQIGSSLLKYEEGTTNNRYNRSDSSSESTSVSSALNSFDFVDEIAEVLDVEMFTGSLSKHSRKRNVILNQLHGMHEFENNSSGGSLRSVSSLPGFLNNEGTMKKWKNVDELDAISVKSYNGTGWVVGDNSEAESTAASARPTPFRSPPPSAAVPTSTPPERPQQQRRRSVEESAVRAKHAPSNDEPSSHQESEAAVASTDWQYTLPSPPTAFRDGSPVAFAASDVGRGSVVDSVVTSPELFEKLQAVKDSADQYNQSEKGTASDITSTLSEEERPILNKLSLEHLEKRKSLVYNRELATSLKMPEEERKTETFTTSLATFEKAYDEMKKSSPKQVIPTSTLPNFKITTYDEPKKKLNIFEDDTIRSNTVENVTWRKNVKEEKPQEYTFFRPPPPKTNTVLRSESFSKEAKWVPSRPVTRSKSQVALNGHKSKQHVERDENLTKSNSLFDVSGLQSLGVMRLIQNKLNTPHGSMEQLDEETRYQKQPDNKNEVQTHAEPVKTYQYRVPAINMGTWSDRPKVPVNMKEDPDYRYSVKDTHSKLVVNTVHNSVKSHNAVEVRHKTGDNVRVKVNGESITGQNTGNVVIKIGGATRRPLRNVENHQRPVSYAFGTNFDISRVPIVRSMELKKPFKDVHSNTSVTQIYQNGVHARPMNNGDPGYGTTDPGYGTKHRNFGHTTNTSAPVVRGFRASAPAPVWSSTLPAKTSFSANAAVPFSQSNLRRTESIKTEVGGKTPPVAPAMPKAFAAPVTPAWGPDPKEQLLQAIRDFGGKKGLRAVKA